jgi:single-strand DNA-binding protein
VSATDVTLIGNLTADPELRFTQTGTAVAVFTVASTERVKDSTTGEWRDGDATFLRCNVWREVAENVAASLSRGDRVVVSGRLRQRSYETSEGDKRTVIEVEVSEVAPSLRFAQCEVKRVTRSGAHAAPGKGPAAVPAFQAA